MDLISLLIVLILVGFALWLLGTLSMIDPTIKQIIRGVILLIVVLWLINLFVGPIHIPLRR